jgi:hypothetical protein
LGQSLLELDARLTLYLVPAQVCSLVILCILWRHHLLNSLGNHHRRLLGSYKCHKTNVLRHELKLKSHLWIIRYRREIAGSTNKVYKSKLVVHDYMCLIDALTDVEWEEGATLWQT